MVIIAIIGLGQTQMVEHLRVKFAACDVSFQAGVTDKKEHDEIISSNGHIIRLFDNENDTCSVYTGFPTWNVYNAADSRQSCLATLEYIVRRACK